MRRVLRVFVGLMLALLVAGVAAGGEAVTMQAEAGFDGRVKPGTWAPVTVTLTNSGPELNADLVFTTEFNWGPGKHTTDYTTPVVLPAGSTKKVQLVVPTEVGSVPEIRLMAGGKMLGTVLPKPETTRDPMIGVLGVEPAELKGLAGAKLGDQTIRLAPLGVDSFPTQPLVLENLDAVLLDRFAIGELSAAQRTALQGWVENGGTLILAGGPEAARLQGLAPWVPVAVSGTGTVDLPGIGKAPLASFDLKNWQAGRRVGGQPLVATFQKGSGKVVLFTFDPALEPFASWSGLPALFGEVLPTPALVAGPNPWGGQPPVQALMNMAGGLMQMPLGALPSMKTLLLVLGVYALVLGPVHFLALKAFRRTGWALMTLPVLAIAGAGGGWLYIARARTSDVVANQMAVIEGEPGGTSARAQVVASFLTPPGARHQVALGDGLAVSLPSNQDMAMMGMQTQGDTHATIRDGRSVALEPMERWSNRTVGGRAIVPVSGSVDGTVIIDQAQVTGKLTNKLPFAIKDALIICGNGFQKVDRWEPGQTVDVNLAAPMAAVQVNPKMGPAGNIMDVVNRATQVNGPFPPDGPTAEQQAQMRRQQMTWNALGNVSWMQSPDHPLVALVGWTDWSPLPIQVDGKPLKATGEGMYVQALAYDFSDGDFAVPPGLLSPKVVKWVGTSGFMYLMPGWNPPKGSAVTVDYQVPAKLAGRVTHLELQVPILGAMAPGTFPLTFRFYRWTDDTWVSVPVDFVTAKLDNAGPFVSPDGTVRIEMAKPGEEQVPLGTPVLSVSGKGVRS